MARSNTKPRQYFFVDESGDPTFYNRRGVNIVGQEGCSKILILGLIRAENPTPLRKAVLDLRAEVMNDPYLKDIPSLKKTEIAFHAKDDSPEIREKFFKLIKTLDFKAEFVVARKIESLFQNRHKGRESLFYNDIVSKLFENKLHVANENYIYFAVRGNSVKQLPFEDAIQTAILSFENKWKIKNESQISTNPQSPSGEPCLQIIDYMNWAVQRIFVKGDSRFYNFVEEKISFLVDIYDFNKYPKNFYSKKNKFDITKISPL
jgi:stress-induced morphogen